MLTSLVQCVCVGVCVFGLNVDPINKQHKVGIWGFETAHKDHILTGSVGITLLAEIIKHSLQAINTQSKKRVLKRHALDTHLPHTVQSSFYSLCFVCRNKSYRVFCIPGCGPISVLGAATGPTRLAWSWGRVKSIRFFTSFTDLVSDLIDRWFIQSAAILLVPAFFQTGFTAQMLLCNNPCGN